MKIIEQWLEQGLHGIYFLTIDTDGYLSHQGIVETTIDATHYLVTYFSWLSGCDNGSQVVSVDEIKSWMFYDSHEQFLYAAENHHKCRFREAKEKRRIQREDRYRAISEGVSA